MKAIITNKVIFRKAIKHAMFPVIFYLIIFCLLTYPLILKFFTHFYSDNLDGLQNVWNLWWVNSAILRPNLYPSIWQTYMLHWPYGTTLIGQTLNPFNGFLAVFLLRFLSMTATYNAITIFSFVMGGLTMYWLAFYLSRSFWGSIIAGFIFTFSDYHFIHAHGHLQLVSLEWIPLFILCWYLLINKPRTIIAVGSAIVLWMVILCDYYYFFYCVLIAILILLWYAFINKNIRFIVRKDHFVPLATFFVIALLLIGPIVGNLVLSNYRDPFLSPHDPVNYSLDLLALIIPGGGWLFDRWTQFYWSKLPGNISESSVYLGLPVFVLIGYALKKRVTLDLADKRQIILWCTAMGLFFLLALGPALHVFGIIIWNKFMPYTLLVSALPFLKLSGLPVRMTVMIILCASILSAIGLRELFRQFPKKMLFTFSLLGIILFGALPTPLATTKIEVPEYVTSLAGLPNDGGVVDMVTEGISLPLYFQTIYKKPLAFGYISRVPKSVSKKDAALIETIQNRDYGKLWDTYHIRYIITKENIEAQAVQPYITIQIAYDKEDIRIYRIGCDCESKE